MKRVVFICVSLVILTAAVFWPVRQQQFVNFDDDIYVTDNPHVANGFSLENVRWAFTATRGTHWWPLTWLSHMLDCQIFGLNAGAQKLVNVAFHIASTLLLFLFLQRTTRATGPSVFVAAVFALHPLRVESVAWVAERKDVLSMFFWMLTLYCYSYYVERPGWKRYVWVVISFALGLMSKPMIVTLPFVLLLLDYWPLRRTTKWSRLVLEKLPLIALTLAASIATYAVARNAQALVSTESIPWGNRVVNALISYARYLGKCVWQTKLAVFYPYSTRWSLWQILGAVGVLGGVSAFAVAQIKRRPYVPVGWFWYLVTLLPVIGLVQVGWQSMADRFTYIPLVGIFIGVAWTLDDALGHRARMRLVTTTLAVTVIAACAIATRLQIQYWQDSVTLFRRATAVTAENSIALANLGVALCNQGQVDEGIADLTKALQYSPRYAYAHNHLGQIDFSLGRTNEALEHLRTAVELAPNDASGHNNLGIALAKTGNNQAATAEFNQAIRLRPDYALAYGNLGGVLVDAGRFAEALSPLREAVRLKPDFAAAHFYLGEAMAQQGQVPEARNELEIAVKLDPHLAGERRTMEQSIRELGPAVQGLPNR